MTSVEIENAMRRKRFAQIARAFDELVMRLDLDEHDVDLLGRVAQAVSDLYDRNAACDSWVALDAYEVLQEMSGPAFLPRQHDHGARFVLANLDKFRNRTDRNLVRDE